MIDLNIKCYPEAEKLKISKKVHQQVVNFVLVKGTNEAVNIARREAPIKTGNLRRTITSEVKYPKGIVKSGARSDGTPYWGFIQYGTRPHEIVGKHKMLKFNVNGKTVFAKSVQHPGTAPNPFVTRTMNKMRLKFLRYYKQAVAHYYGD